MMSYFYSKDSFMKQKVYPNKLELSNNLFSSVSSKSLEKKILKVPPNIERPLETEKKKNTGIIK
jgi:hypothetical protein